MRCCHRSYSSKGIAMLQITPAISVVGTTTNTIAINNMPPQAVPLTSGSENDGVMRIGTTKLTRSEMAVMIARNPIVRTSDGGRFGGKFVISLGRQRATVAFVRYFARTSRTAAVRRRSRRASASLSRVSSSSHSAIKASTFATIRACSESGGTGTGNRLSSS